MCPEEDLPESKTLVHFNLLNTSVPIKSWCFWFAFSTWHNFFGLNYKELSTYVKWAPDWLYFLLEDPSLFCGEPGMTSSTSLWIHYIWGHRWTMLYIAGDWMFRPLLSSHSPPQPVHRAPVWAQPPSGARRGKNTPLLPGQWGGSPGQFQNDGGARVWILWHVLLQHFLLQHVVLQHLGAEPLNIRGQRARPPLLCRLQPPLGQHRLLLPGRGGGGEQHLWLCAGWRAGERTWQSTSPERSTAGGGRSGRCPGCPGCSRD